LANSGIWLTLGGNPRGNSGLYNIKWASEALTELHV